MTSTPMLSMLEHFLDVASARHKLIVSNVANVDTPGYQTRDLDFAAELRRTLNSGATATPVARLVPGLMERPDGNNVSMDRESLLLAETQMQYHIGVQLVRNEFSRFLTAINGGGNQG